MKRKFYVLFVMALYLSITSLIAGDDKKAITEIIEQEEKAFNEGDIDAWSE